MKKYVPIKVIKDSIRFNKIVNKDQYRQFVFEKGYQLFFPLNIEEHPQYISWKDLAGKNNRCLNETAAEFEKKINETFTLKLNDFKRKSKKTGRPYEY